MRSIPIGLFVLGATFLSPAFAVTATYAVSSQTVKLTGLGGTGGVGTSRVDWGTCAYDGKNTNCTVSAPYTGVGGGGTISMVLSYGGNATVSPFTAVSISPGSDEITFGLLPGNSGSITVSLQENTGAKINFLSNNFVFHFNQGATCSASCSVGQIGLTPGTTISGTVNGQFDATPAISTAISASAYGGFAQLAPGTWMEIYGSNLANVLSQTWAGSDFKGNAAPTTLGATTVTIGGQSAFVDYVSPTQVNAQVPSNIGTGAQQVIVNTPGGTSNSFGVTVNATQPGLLAPGVFKLNAGQYAGATFADGSTFVLPPGAISGVASARAKPGDTIIFYGVGFGTVTPDSPAGQIVTASNKLNGNMQVAFNGVPATVSFAGLTGGYLGLYQFNVVVPNVSASDSVPVTFTLGGTAGTQKLILPISN